MANLRDDIRKLWTDTFDDKAEWVEMFFTRVYRDDDVMELQARRQRLASGKRSVASTLRDELSWRHCRLRLYMRSGDATQ